MNGASGLYEMARKKENKRSGEEIKFMTLIKLIKDRLAPKVIEYLKGINYLEDKHTGEINLKISLQEGGIRNVESSRTDKTN